MPPTHTKSVDNADARTTTPASPAACTKNHRRVSAMEYARRLLSHVSTSLASLVHYRGRRAAAPVAPVAAAAAAAPSSPLPTSSTSPAPTGIFTPDHYPDIPDVDLLTWTFANVDRFPDRQIYIDAADPTNALTARDVLLCVRQLIAGFKARGITPGDNICVLSFNNILYSPLYLAIIGAGGCVVGANPAYGHTELKHILAVSAVRTVLVQPELLPKLLPAARECGIADANILVFDTDKKNNNTSSTSPFQSWTTLLTHGESDWVRFPSTSASASKAKSKSTPASLMSTSGTTGLPKAALISHHAHVAQSILLHSSVSTPLKPYPIRRLLCLPQFHAFAAPLFHCAPLRDGHTTYIMKRYYREAFVRYLGAYGITETAVVPPIVRDLVGVAGGREQKGVLEGLRFVWCAGAALSGGAQRGLCGVLHAEAVVAQVWGLSEMGWITTFGFAERDGSGSVGRLLPGMEARVVCFGGDGGEGGVEGGEGGEGGEGEWWGGGKVVTEDNVRGEIFVRGPSIMNGYLGNDAATRETILEGGWLRTGDIGFVEKGKWYICDRAKEIIKVKGWQVSPTELEECLLAHPLIRDAAVIGIELGPDMGDVPRAYVVPETPVCCYVADTASNSDSTNKDDKVDKGDKGDKVAKDDNEPHKPDTQVLPLTQEDVAAWVRDRMASFKALTGGVVFVESIPKAASGKVLRGVLRERARGEVGDFRG
ncbi:acetyl-CoA synthetase-like protein [Pseudovirgaria hyperparasitica]|uniref:Acetyl-CoA synthetase-like protein n=1 Tax=Pseudovirgaria hyperparasitica TaxID=470096 RepID=A0A6A6W867_9PEZI|nr:acetyl-CoA synthetase-like protein [Pseudovirgaria hyperparasitica]KAF2758399.1 acetyl-CoA synthetase-like protein [Pseudovirgaria hyperparasitica]